MEFEVSTRENTLDVDFQEETLTFGGLNESLLGKTISADVQISEVNLGCLEDGMCEDSSTLSLDTEGASLSFGEAVLLSSLRAGSELFNTGEKVISSEMPLQDARQRTTEEHSEHAPPEHENDASPSFGESASRYTGSPTELIAASSFDGQRIYFGRRCKRQHSSNVIIQSRFSVNFLAYFY
jgi:hypothetical protein